jgi:hypothetical protein
MTRDNREEITKQLLAMLEAGRTPTGSQSYYFWNNIMAHARQKKDVKLFKRSLDAIKKLFGDNPQYKRMIETLEKQLAELEK